MKPEIYLTDFVKIDIRVGTIIDVKIFEKAIKPSYQLYIDFGEEIGKRKSCTQIIDLYNKEN